MDGYGTQDWLVEKFNLDLSLVARLGGHSQPRTHRGKERFPGMTITYALIQMLEKVAEKTDRARIVTKAKVFKLVTDNNACVPWTCHGRYQRWGPPAARGSRGVELPPFEVGCVYEKGGQNFQEFGPVILASGVDQPPSRQWWPLPLGQVLLPAAWAQLVQLSYGTSMVTSISTAVAGSAVAESQFEQGVWLAYTTPLRGFWGWLLGSIPAYHLAVLINGFVYEISVPGMRFIGLSGSGSATACSGKGSRFPWRMIQPLFLMTSFVWVPPVWGAAPGNHQCSKSRADLQRWASTFDVEQYNLLSNNCQTFVIELVAYAIDQDVREAKRIIERTLRMPLS
eukprot:Skav213893  [mRNA]  locus=scaffold245:255887:260104:- [translate_table: standard]